MTVTSEQGKTKKLTGTDKLTCDCRISANLTQSPLCMSIGILYAFIFVIMIKTGTRPMDTFYAKYTNVFHTQNLADV